MRSRLRSDDGANAVEFALILPILVLLLFGAITFGIAYNQKQQLEHANREAVRFAATLSDAGSDAWFDAVYDRLVLAAAGQAPVTDDGLSVCVSVGETSTVTSRRRDGDAGYTSAADLSGNSDDGTGAHCVTGTSDTTVQVTISRDARLDAVFFRRDLAISTDGIARYEEG